MTAAQLREHVRVGGLLSSGCGVVAMLSGGRDSVCLLDVAVTLCGAEQVHALHVNYGLRAESDGDERHCRELCALLGVKIEVVQASREEQATGNLHAWARELRYAAACELAQRLDERRDTRDDGSLAACAACRGSPRRRTRRRGGRCLKARCPARAQGASCFFDSDRNGSHRHRSGRDDPLPPCLFAGAPGAARHGRQRGTACAPIVGADAPGHSRLLSGAEARMARGLEQRQRALRPRPCAPRARQGARRRAPGGAGQRPAYRRALARGDRAARCVGGCRAWRGREHRDRASKTACACIAAARGHSLGRAGKRRACSAGRRARWRDPCAGRAGRSSRAARRRPRRRCDRGRRAVHGRDSAARAASTALSSGVPEQGQAEGHEPQQGQAEGHEPQQGQASAREALPEPIPVDADDPDGQGQ